jgi:Zn-dependent membrane protease YugP
MLERYGLVTRQEAEGVKAVLDAAALTYVAAAATAILQMLYYVSLLMRRR